MCWTSELQSAVEVLHVNCHLTETLYPKSAPCTSAPLQPDEFETCMVTLAPVMNPCTSTASSLPQQHRKSNAHGCPRLPTIAHDCPRICPRMPTAALECPRLPSNAHGSAHSCPQKHYHWPQNDTTAPRRDIVSMVSDSLDHRGAVCCGGASCKL